MEQDGHACELNQRGLRSTAFDRGVLMQEEYEVYAFHRWVKARLGEGDPLASRASRRTTSSRRRRSFAGSPRLLSRRRSTSSSRRRP